MSAALLPPFDLAAALRLSTWRRPLELGVLGAVVLTAMEFLLLPTTLSLAERLPLALYILARWTIAGTLIAAFALSLESRLAPPAIAAGLVLLALATSAAFAGVRGLMQLAGIPSSVIPFAGGLPWWSAFTYDVWIQLFFGGLFTGACVIAHRAERLRETRARMAIERSHTEALLAEAQLRALEAHVDPAFLLRVVDLVQRRYAVDTEAADRLLDALVAFLRRAMPGVRGRVMTLADEIELARAYADVWSLVDPARPRWTMRVEAGAGQVPFPGLVLPALLDRWAAAAPPRATATLCVAEAAGLTTVTLDAPAPATADWVTPAQASRLRIALRVANGADAALLLGSAAAGAPALRIVLPCVPGRNDRPASLATPADGAVRRRRQTVTPRPARVPPTHPAKEFDA